MTEQEGFLTPPRCAGTGFGMTGLVPFRTAPEARLQRSHPERKLEISDFKERGMRKALGER